MRSAAGAPRGVRLPASGRGCHLITVLPLLIVSLLASAGQPASERPAAAIEEEARRIESMLIAPCCFSQQVSLHQSEAAETVRRDVRSRLRAGQTREEILQAYVQQYGKRILAEPEPEGFGLLLLAIPVVFLVLTALALAVVVRRFSRSPGASALPAGAGVSPSLVEQLETELRDLD